MQKRPLSSLVTLGWAECGRIAAKARLKGFKERRKYQGVVAFHYGLSPRQAERKFGWNRIAVEKALKEHQTGELHLDRLAARGRRKVEEKHPEIAAAIYVLLIEAHLKGTSKPGEEEIRNHLAANPETKRNVPSVPTVSKILQRLHTMKELMPRCVRRGKHWNAFKLRIQVQAATSGDRQYAVTVPLLASGGDETKTGCNLVRTIKEAMFYAAIFGPPQN